MIKDSNSYKSTGGWRFERFVGDNALRTQFTTLDGLAFNAIRKPTSMALFSVSSIDLAIAAFEPDHAAGAPRPPEMSLR
jgi:hypothetical protein